ncbi:Golgi integral membrane protein 4-like [Hemicordylus capensis]|uniref:Golgi integral membrane protein 4-like n=1 Tax=Hemicordylus capensis TaxID=884348 RepID=UPI002303C29D|nr:Golgi integral membrane protein 4-like [Hemicordylus capensis]
MGTGMCTRRQKGLLQTGFCLVAVACLGSGAFLYNHLQQKVKAADALASKYKQQQEALSAQLQVVYEHRSRLERSLQKERGEHKKTKEDFLVYKLEAQEALNKEKQDSMNRYGALSSQHKILKNQHEDVKKQLLDLQLQHNGLKLEHRKTIETHNQKYSQLQREKDGEVVGLQDTVYKLREESKLLRKAHQDVHSQLLSAQVQMEEFRQLKETLQKMPSFKDAGTAKGVQQQQPPKEPPPGAGRGLLPLPVQKASTGNEGKLPLSPLEKGAAAGGSFLVAQAPAIKHQGGENVQAGQVPHSNDDPRSQREVPFGQLAPPLELHLPPAAWPQAGQRDSHVVRFTRTVNSVQNGNPDPNAIKNTKEESEENAPSQAIMHGIGLPPASEKAQTLDKQPSTGNKQDPLVQSWQDIVNKVNARMDEEQAPHFPQSLQLGIQPEQAMQDRDQGLASQRRQQGEWGAGKRGLDDEELQMDAGMIEREDSLHPGKEGAIQELMVPDDAADPAQDPNNQGEDEFEEAELERPDFEEKAQTHGPVKDVTKEEIQKDAVGQKKTAGDLMEDYQEDQEQDLEDHGGEVDDADDLELVRGPKGHAEGDGKKDYYY